MVQVKLHVWSSLSHLSLRILSTYLQVQNSGSICLVHHEMSLCPCHVRMDDIKDHDFSEPFQCEVVKLCSKLFMDKWSRHLTAFHRHPDAWKTAPAFWGSWYRLSVSQVMLVNLSTWASKKSKSWIELLWSADIDRLSVHRCVILSHTSSVLSVLLLQNGTFSVGFLASHLT